MTKEDNAVLRGDIKGIVFDLDGTLADTSPDIAAALNAALREVGHVALPLAEVTTMIGGGIPTLVARAIERLGASGSLQDILVERMFYHYARGFCVNSQLMVGVADCLFALQHLGLPMAVCTNKDQIIAEKIIWTLGIEHYFTAMVGRQPEVPKKPDPAMLRLAVERIGCTADTVVMVGDSDVDAATARAAGTPSVIVRNGYFSGDYESLCTDFLIDDMTGFMPLITTLTRV